MQQGAARISGWSKSVSSVIVIAIAIAGCALGPVATQVAVRIVMTIGTEIAVQEGMKFLQSITGPDQARQSPTLNVQYADSSGSTAAANYGIDSATGISITTSHVSGHISIDGDSRAQRVTVPPGSSATIVISQAQSNIPAQVPGEPVGSPPEAASPTEPASASATALVGMWKGHYYCNQGLTRLELTISAGATSDALSAKFAFSADPSNPDVPSGSFAMQGTYVNGRLSLQGDHWIDEPVGYIMVDLTADVGPNDHTINGAVSAGCSTFSVDRA
jgi:hypothetical protein